VRRKERILVAVTGTPAAGKSTLAESISKETGSSIIEINAVVEKKRAYIGKDKGGSKIVQLRKLKAAVTSEIKKKTGMILIVGHLAQELGIHFDIAVVARAPLKTLVSRMEKRKYSRGKITENLVSEAVDYCGSKISGLSKETYEVSTDSEKRSVTRYLVALASGKTQKKPKIKYVERVGELEGLIKEGWTF
jgi:broad-specificity NMP kinase